MKNKILFIDRDNTINHDCPYCHDPSQLKIFGDSVELMKRYQENGYHIVVLTNQSGINRGYFTVEQMNSFNDALKSELEKRGVHIERIYYCPHRPDENCNCRKPKTELLDRAIRDFDADISQSLIVGDRDDMEGEMARRKGMKYLILDRN